MEVLKEILLRIVLEPLVYLYCDLAEGVGREKKLKNGRKNLLMVLCSLVFLLSFFAFLIGAFWVLDTEPYRTWGRVLLFVGGGVLLAQIAVGAFVAIKRYSNERWEQAIKAEELYGEKEPSPHVYCADGEGEEKTDIDWS